MRKRRKFKVYENKKRIKRSGKKYRETKMTFFIIIIVLIYMTISMIKFWATDKLQYVMANEGSVNITNTVKGMITRNEQVCEAQDKGYIEYLYTEGEKIRKNSVICTIKDTYYEDIIENKIDLVDGEIKRSQSDFGEKTYYTEKIKDMNNLLYDTIDRFLITGPHNDLEDVHNLKDNISKLITNRNYVYVIEKNNKLFDLMTTKKGYQNQLNTNSKFIKATKSGIITYSYDDIAYDKDNNPLDYSMITYDMIENYDSSSFKNIKIEKNSVDKGNKIYRFITSDIWYITFFIDESVKESYVKDNRIKLKLDNQDKFVWYDIIEMVKAPNNKYKLTLKIDQKVNQYLNRRIVDITLSDNDIDGIKIPKSSILLKNVYVVPSTCITNSRSITGVIKLLDEDGQVFEPVEVVYKEDDNVYIEAQKDDNGIALNDRIVNNKGKNQEIYAINKTAQLEGVYIVNNNYKKFRKTDIIYSTKEYVIISTDSPYGVRMYDRILQNAEEE